MTVPLVTQQHLEDLMRKLQKLETRIGQVEVRESTTGTFGVYTPTYTGGTAAGVTTYAFQAGVWRRFGDQITVVGQVNWSAATGTGEARISLPFAPVTYNFTGSVWLSGVTFANSAPELLASPGNLYFVLDSPLTNAAPGRVQMEAAGSVVWGATYFA